MTCIVGFVDRQNNCVWIGGDSLGSNGFSKSVYSTAKVFRHDIFKNVVMGSTTTYRHIDLLKYSENLFPEIDFYKLTEIDHRYMVKTFIPNLLTLFQNNVLSESEKDRGGNFLLGAKDKLFEIQSDYSVLEPSDGYAAVGCGCYAAEASLFTTVNNFPSISPIDHIKHALEAAEHSCCGVQRPFKIINTKTEEEIVVE